MPPLALPEGLYADVEGYYSRKLARFGPTALGVDWSCELTQQLRFVHLLKVCDVRLPFSINDFGCGYGALVSFLRKRHPNKVAAYHGVDLSQSMIAAARRLHGNCKFATFEVARALPNAADFCVASGVFNVKLAQPRHIWERFVQQGLAHLDHRSKTGFAVNFLLPLAHADAPAQLYCVEPETWARYCERELGRDVKVLLNYGLTEFTLIVRRADACRGNLGRRERSNTSAGS